MEHKLIKIETEYYLTTEVKVVEGEYGVIFAHGIRGVGRGWNTYYHEGRPGHKLNAICYGSRKITHSTAPIDGDEVGSCFNTIKQLSLKNCQAIERGYDLDELAKEFVDYEDSLYHSTIKNTYMHGFQKSLEILSDKKFSEEDMMQLVKSSFYAGLSKGQGKNQDFNIDDYVKEHLQQTEWDVEVEMEDPIGIGDKHTPDTKPKLDADGCIILKRK